MFKTKFQEIFNEIFPADGLVLELQEGEDFLTNNLEILKEEFLSPYGWESFLKMKCNNWLYSCFQGKSTVYLFYLRIKDGRYLHFRDKVRMPADEGINLKNKYYKIIECLTYMTLTNEKSLKIVYNEGLLMINGKTKKSFFSDSIEEEEKKG